MRSFLAHVLTLFVFLMSTEHGAASENQKEKRYTYHEHDGVFVYYETQDRETYRKILPDVFEMPDQPTVYSFVSDFYKMDSQTKPYKEAAIFLLAKHNGRSVWHCVFMPVTSEESRRLGVRRLGLPKTIGDIDFSRNLPKYRGTARVEGGKSMLLTVDTQDYKLNQTEEQWVRKLSTLPKLNLRNGQVLEMKRPDRRSIIDLALFMPNRIHLKGGRAEIEHLANGDMNHPLGLSPSKTLAAYYLRTTIPFRLGGKVISD